MEEILMVYALTQSFFVEKTGKRMKSEKFEEFINDHIKDGKFTLPDPKEIDFEKYI